MSSPPEALPQLWQRPSSTEILCALEGLQISPPVWNFKRRRSDILRDQDAAAHVRREVTAYLSSVIKSSLAWIDDDDAKDAIWTEASKRMSERCGRAAMGEITRRWPFDIEGTPSFELAIREPPITGDCLGFKTWGSSYLLAFHLPRLAATTLFRLFDESFGQPRPQVLELGSGTGLLGLAAAALWRAPVYLSDLPEIVPNLRVNLEANRSLIESCGGSLDVGALTWGGSEEDVDQKLFGKENQFKVILVADPLYDDDHPALLSSAINEQLALSPEARAIVMVPLRDETTIRLLAAFRIIMSEEDKNLACVEEGDLAGQDDWDEDEQESELRCWWGVFARQGEVMASGSAS